MEMKAYPCSQTVKLFKGTNKLQINTITSFGFIVIIRPVKHKIYMI